MHILEVWSFLKNRNVYHVINIYPAGRKMKTESETVCKYVYV